MMPSDLSEAVGDWSCAARLAENSDFWRFEKFMLCSQEGGLMTAFIYFSQEMIAQVSHVEIVRVRCDEAIKVIIM